MSNIEINTAEVQRTAQRLANAVKKLGDVFEEQDRNIAKINGTSIWSSESQLSCCAKYNKLSSKQSQIIDHLQSMVIFLNSASGAYEKIDAITSAKVDKEL